MSANREPTPNQAVLWTIDDLAAYLRCSVAQAYKTVALQSIPRVEVFRRGMRFDPGAVQAWAVARRTRS
jgi:hypothetical protein